MRKIVFIINSVQQQRCIKRIKQFIDCGYDVDVYGFSRNKNITTHPAFDIQIVGSFSNHSTYILRSLYMLKKLYPILWKYRKYKHECCFYFFGLDIALLSKLILRKCTYIYEESDLMHTYIGTRCVKKILERKDIYTIKESLATILTSEGFYQYHFGEVKVSNVFVVANKLNKKILSIKPEAKCSSDRLQLGFVGAIRYHSLLNFVQVICANYKNIDFHFWGIIQDLEDDFKRMSTQYSNVYFHGAFINPDDLPKIYAQIHIVVAVYDYRFENVRYAEPNKLYEAIYFEVPIVVSSNTYLSQKVSKMNIEYVVDPFDSSSIKGWLDSLSKEDIEEKVLNCKKIDKFSLISDGNDFIKKLNL